MNTMISLNPQKRYLTNATHARPESLDSGTSPDDQPNTITTAYSSNPMNTTTVMTTNTAAAMTMTNRRANDSARQSIVSNGNTFRSSAQFSNNTNSDPSKEQTNANGWLVNAGGQGLNGGGSNGYQVGGNSGMLGGDGSTSGGVGGGGGGNGGPSDNANAALYQTSRLVERSSSNFSHGKEKKTSVGYRLGKRKLLFEKRRQISDYALIFAMTGVFLMIIETEFSMSRLYEKVKQ